MNRTFIVPDVTAESTEKRARLDPAALISIAPAQLHSQCVPAPYAQAELMAHVLAAETGAQAQVVKTSAMLRQAWDRWKTLLVGLVLGKVEYRSEFLQSPEADNFGTMLVTARPEVRYLGVLRTEELGPVAPNRPKRVVGGVDPECLFWAAPRVSDTQWADLDQRVGRGQQEEKLALQILLAWREGLKGRSLYDGVTGPVWMRALDALLDGANLKPGDVAEGHRLVATEVEMVGPALLYAMRGTEGARALTSIYLPVHRPQRERLLHQVLMWQPTLNGVGVVEFRAPNAPPEVLPTWKIRLVAGAANASKAEQLVAGVGRLEADEGPKMLQDRTLRLENVGGRAGYASLVYEPLLRTVRDAHEAAGLQVTEADMAQCPALFPDTLRLVRPLRVGAQGRAVARYSRNLRNDELPLFAELLIEEIQHLAELAEPKYREELMVALSGTPPRLTLVERVAGRREEPAELRALGGALWELFTDDARVEGASIVRTRGDGGKLLTLPTGAETVWFDGKYLQELRTTAGQDALAARAWCRRATLHRFARTWSDLWSRVRAGGSLEPGGAAGSVAAWCFVDWVARAQTGRGIEEPGGVPGARTEHVLELVPGVVRVPIARDRYAREGGV